MKSVIQWAIKNSPAMNTLLIVSMLIGAISMVIMRREVFPNFALEVVLVTVPLPGETPDEIEDCLLYTSPSPRDGLLSRMPSSA